jgi:hypothetical protein
VAKTVRFYHAPASIICPQCLGNLTPTDKPLVGQVVMFHGATMGACSLAGKTFRITLPVVEGEEVE